MFFTVMLIDRLDLLASRKRFGKTFLSDFALSTVLRLGKPAPKKRRSGGELWVADMRFELFTSSTDSNVLSTELFWRSACEWNFK